MYTTAVVVPVVGTFIIDFRVLHQPKIQNTLLRYVRGIFVCSTEPVAPLAQRYPCNLLTRWDVSSIPANGIFLTKKN